MHWIALQPEALDASDALADPHMALAWWALQFTPLVARVNNALVLEVSGSERLFGGRDALVERLYASNKPLEHMKLAQGATKWLAF